MVGCNTGSTLALLREHSPDAIGLDINHRALQYAEGPRVNANVVQLPFLDNSIYCILALDVIEHIYVEDMPKLVQEFRRVAECALIVCPRYPSPGSLDPSHVQFFEQATDMAQPWQAYFEIKQCENLSVKNPSGEPHELCLIVVG